MGEAFFSNKTFQELFAGAYPGTCTRTPKLLGYTPAHCDTHATCHCESVHTDATRRESIHTNESIRKRLQIGERRCTSQIDVTQQTVEINANRCRSDDRECGNDHMCREGVAMNAHNGKFMHVGANQIEIVHTNEN